MPDYVSKYTCGSCSNYDYEGENTKGYCNYYKSYYFPDDSCSHWEESDSVSSSGSGGCFITSACCEHKGLSDDCAQLQTLRRFRDTYLKDQPYGSELIQLYYADAPAIVTAINASTERETIYDGIFETVNAIVALIDSRK